MATQSAENGPQGLAPSDTQGQPGTPGAPPPVINQPITAHRVHRTRIGGMWVAAASFAVVLLLLLIFILENGQSVSISYFGAHGHLPFGVAVLLAAVLGVLLVAIPATGRIIQLRITARRHRHADARVVVTAPPGAEGPEPGQQPPA